LLSFAKNYNHLVDFIDTDDSHLCSTVVAFYSLSFMLLSIPFFSTFMLLVGYHQ